MACPHTVTVTDATFTAYGPSSAARGGSIRAVRGEAAKPSAWRLSSPIAPTWGQK